MNIIAAMWVNLKERRKSLFFLIIFFHAARAAVSPRTTREFFLPRMHECFQEVEKFLANLNE